MDIHVYMYMYIYMYMYMYIYMSNIQIIFVGQTEKLKTDTVVLKKNLRVHERAARVLTLTRKDSHRVRDAYVHFARVNARVSLACHA